MPVNSRHPDFDHHIADWTMLRDAIAGERIVKEKDELYLPMRHGFRERPDTGKQWYKDYKHRAQFPHATEANACGMPGVIHRREAEIKLPKSLEKYWEATAPDGAPLANAAQMDDLGHSVHWALIIARLGVHRRGDKQRVGYP